MKTVRPPCCTYVGSAVVEVRIKKEFLKKSRNQNLMMIAKVINSLKLGATDMKSRSFRYAAVTFPNKGQYPDGFKRT